MYHPDLPFVSFLLGAPRPPLSPSFFPYACLSTEAVVYVDPLSAVAASSLKLPGPISLVRLSGTFKSKPDPNMFKRRLCPATELSMPVPIDKLRPLGDPLSAILWSGTARYTAERVGVKGVSLVNGLISPTPVRKNGIEYCSASLVLSRLESDGTVTHSYRWTYGQQTVLELSVVQLAILCRIRERHPFAWLDQVPLMQKATYERLCMDGNPLFMLVYGWQEDDSDRLTMEAYHVLVTSPHFFDGHFFSVAHASLFDDHDAIRRLVTKWCNCQTSMQSLHEPSSSFPHLWWVLLAFDVPGIKIELYRKLYWNPFVATAARGLCPETKPLEWLSALFSAPGSHDVFVNALAQVGEKRPAFMTSLLLLELPNFDSSAVPVMMLVDYFVRPVDRRLLLDRMLGKSRVLTDESDRTVADLWAEIKKWHSLFMSSSSTSSTRPDCNELLALIQRKRGEKVVVKSPSYLRTAAIKRTIKKTVSPARDRRVKLMTSVPGERKIASNGPIRLKPIVPIKTESPSALVPTYNSPDFVKRVPVEPYDPTCPQITGPIDPTQLDRLYSKLVSVQQIPDPVQQGTCLQHYAYGASNGHLHQWPPMMTS